MQQGIKNCYINGIRVKGARSIKLDPIIFSKSYRPAGAVRDKTYREELIGYSGALEVYDLPEELFADCSCKLKGVSLSYESDGTVCSYQDCDITVPSRETETLSGNLNIKPYTLPILINL